MRYDPSFYGGAAVHYRCGRPPYSPRLEALLAGELGLDGGAPRVIFAPGIPDRVQDVEGVLSNYFSMSWAAPHLFGDRAGEFAGEVRELLTERSPEGVFWDWPGDTEVMLVRK